MADRSSQCLYKETRLNLEADVPESTIVVHLVGYDRSTQSSKALVRRRQPTQTSAAEDETTFAREHLASNASIFFRKRDFYPRSLLWRVLSGRKLLSLQFVDFTRTSKDGAEAGQEVQLVFPDAIRPTGVAVTDDDDHETIDVFVLTLSNDLYTIPLKPDFFRRRSSSSSRINATANWYQTYLSPSFAFRYPHRLAARTSYELVVTLHDGGLLRLTRKPGEDGIVDSVPKMAAC